MKFSLAFAALCVASVEGFAPLATRAVGKAPAKKAPAKKAATKVVKKAPVKKAPVKKAPVKKAPVKKAAPPKPASGPSPSAQAWANAGPSIALPFATAPATLDGSMIGDVGFDPFGFSTVPVGPWFSGVGGERMGEIGNLAWYREAELMHGRIAQLAVLGFIWPGLFGTLPGNDWTGADAYSNTNPIEAFEQVPGFALLQIFVFMTSLEVRRIKIINEEGASYQPGDLRWGQGAGRWNPFKLDYTPEEYAEKQLQELKHCRLAMVGVFGLWAQAVASGESVVDQLGTSFVAPEYYAKAGYFLPEGI
eukprot:CAMPEP_0178911480 /NCGR_PEP_ID=MMETSP0786-20121207/9724_1 /TAXON_ID=186022 /ORGANISM="Thalassionema frauenfeldii, Strain CCMP 1798" /LENGTH=305 /DNA_ID=CAMNT_0020583943 /DNA_START=56 /DNA_END=973 /DNA_ORIENTATION=+